jgi:hypothetical protein
MFYCWGEKAWQACEKKSAQIYSIKATETYFTSSGVASGPVWPDCAKFRRFGEKTDKMLKLFLPKLSIYAFKKIIIPKTKFSK